MFLVNPPRLLTVGAILLQALGGGAFAAESGTAGQPAASDRRLSELFYQLQVLQQEVQELRGLVEEQGYQINRLARDQKEQYIDLDRRVAGLSAGAGAVLGGAGVSPAAGAPPGASAQPGASSLPSPGAPQTTSPLGTVPATSGTAVAALPSGSEREAYQRAFDLMKARQFDQSIGGFNQLIVNYPNGQYTPNAFYWLGELHLAQQNTEQARQSFMQVLNLYPDHPKVPDTLYKLGVAYHRLGDTSRALEYFNQVRSQYPQSSAAGLAASYAQEIQ